MPRKETYIWDGVSLIVDGNEVALARQADSASHFDFVTIATDMQAFDKVLDALQEARDDVRAALVQR